MKKTALILCLLLIGFAFCAQAAERAKGPHTYDQKTAYDGPFKSSLLFVRYERNNLWYPSKRFQSKSQISCAEAYLALQKGPWLGNLDDDGSCLGVEEAPQWATGNYLNFLFNKNKLINSSHQKTAKDTSKTEDSDE